MTRARFFDLAPSVTQHFVGFWHLQASVATATRLCWIWSDLTLVEDFQNFSEQCNFMFLLSLEEYGTRYAPRHTSSCAWNPRGLHRFMWQLYASDLQFAGLFDQIRHLWWVFNLWNVKLTYFNFFIMGITTWTHTVCTYARRNDQWAMAHFIGLAPSGTTIFWHLQPHVTPDLIKKIISVVSFFKFENWKLNVSKFF